MQSDFDGFSMAYPRKRRRGCILQHRTPVGCDSSELTFKSDCKHQKIGLAISLDARAHLHQNASRESGHYATRAAFRACGNVLITRRPAALPCLHLSKTMHSSATAIR